jgi:16S rRNA (adenine1518-N6/adenine1519-N6)-dimethyltransferase
MRYVFSTGTVSRGHDAVKHVAREMKKRGIYLSRRRGQCLLTDESVWQRIIKAAEISPNDVIIDIGTGPGYGLERIAPLCGRYIGVEIDRKCCEAAREKAEPFTNCTVMQADILQDKHTLNPDVTAEIKKHAADKTGGCVKIVSNLPYSVATPVIMNFCIQGEIPLDMMIVMVQKEVAHKLAARPGSASYSSVSAVCRMFCDPDILFQVSPGAFFPRPKVDSAVMRLLPRKVSDILMPEEDIGPFISFVRSVFNYSRKVILNAVINSHAVDIPKKELRELFVKRDIDPGRSLASFAPQELYDVYSAVMQKEAVK